MKNFFRWDHLVTTLLVFAFLWFLPWFFSWDFLEPIQNTMEKMTITDIEFGHLRDYDEVEPEDDIIIINNSHLSRGAFAEVLQMIESYEPAVVGIDAMFRKPKDAEGDEYLSYVLSEYDNIVLAYEVASNEEALYDSLKVSHPMFSDNAMGGYVNMKTSDEVFRTVRRIAPIIEFGDTSTYKSFHVAVAEQYAPEKTAEYLERDNEFELINYRRNIGQGYEYIDVPDIMQDPSILEKVAGKIVLIGYLGPTTDIKSTEDIFYTPMNPAYAGKAEPDMYGVVIHANAISMILDEDYLTQSPDWLPYVIMILVVYLNMVALWTFRRKYLIWSQLLTVGFIIAQLILLPTLVLVLLHWFDFELSLGVVFFAIVVCVLCFELYHDSLKPLAFTYYNKLRGESL